MLDTASTALSYASSGNMRERLSNEAVGHSYSSRKALSIDSKRVSTTVVRQ